MAAPYHTSGRDGALHLIRTAMIEKKLTQAELADAADCHEKTVQNLLNGRSVRDQTMFDVCMVLGLDFPTLKALWEGADPPAGNELKGAGGIVAPLYMGAYTKAAVDHYIGSYLTIRPAFSQPGAIVGYRTDITWDGDWPSLLFQERERPDQPYAHRGRLYVPASSSTIHLVSLTKGAMRMVAVSQLDQTGTMRGIISTLTRSGPMYLPVAAPIVYVRREAFAPEDTGEIASGHDRFEAYRALLQQTVSDSYVRLVLP
jgi:transcriptional regulator with XRE-family HTH domain